MTCDLAPARLTELARGEQDVLAMPGKVAAIRLDTRPLEDLADEAFLAMARLRDRLVARNHNTAACRTDEAIEALQAACREFVK